MSEHVQALVCLSVLLHGSYIKEMSHFGNLNRLANFYVNKKLNGRGDLCRNEECQMDEWGLFTLWMLRLWCANFDFLFKVVLTSKQWCWRTGWLWLLWRLGTSHGWLRTDGIMWDRCMESAAMSRAFLSWGEHNFPEGYNTRPMSDSLRFSWDLIAVLLLHFLLFWNTLSSLDAHAPRPWTLYTLRSFQGEQQDSPAPFPFLPAMHHFRLITGSRQVPVCGAGQRQWTRAFPHLFQWWWGVAVRPLHRAPLSLPQAGTRPAIQLQAFMGLGGCILFVKSSRRGLYKAFRSTLPALKSHLGVGVITSPDEVCQEDLHAARLLNGCISRETALIYSLVSVAHCSPAAMDWQGKGQDDLALVCLTCEIFKSTAKHFNDLSSH